MKKCTATFLFTETYRSEFLDEKSKQVQVKLNIDYIQRTFSVEPSINLPGNTQGFNFIGKNVHFSANKWRAVIQAIDHAIDFGEKELKGNEPPVREPQQA